MSDVVLFHHVLGVTAGIEAFADALREGGHTVTVPDVFDGARFDNLEEGIAHAKSIGFDVVMERGIAAASSLPPNSIYTGFSLGVMPAQKLAQTRPGALGALLFHAAVPLGHFGDSWPSEVALQIHVMEDDDMGDVPEAKELVASVTGAELFLYPGSGHLFTDSSSADYDGDATATAIERSLAFLDRVSTAGG